MAFTQPIQRDALGELVNIGMGQAGESLARLFDRFIQLSIPRIELIEPAQVAGAIAALVGTDGPVIAVRQAFSSCRYSPGQRTARSRGRYCSSVCRLAGSAPYVQQITL